MKRITDQHMFRFSAYTATHEPVEVKCPKCSGKGLITIDSDSYDTAFKCTKCGHSKSGRIYKQSYFVRTQCKTCDRNYRVEIKEKDKQHFKVLNVPCPNCKTLNSGKVEQKETNYIHYEFIKDAKEPYFGLELWYLSSFENKQVWAVNRSHLEYLIDYISADLREKPTDFSLCRTQAHITPTFMKTAKNRDGMLKVLRKMMEEK